MATKREWINMIKSDIEDNGEVFYQGVYEELKYSLFVKYCKELGLKLDEDYEGDA